MEIYIKSQESILSMGSFKVDLMTVLKKKKI